LRSFRPSVSNGWQNSGSAGATIPSAEKARLVYIPTKTTPGTSEPVADCPFCRSRDVKTTSKEANASTYWRCLACGQIWNASRLQHDRRNPYRFV
jgi:hypothetical protein